MPDEPDLRGTFDQAAPLYQSARPAYPAELYDDLVALTRLTPPAEVLEIGAGPGNATVELAQRGFRITALELGAALAEQARLNLAPYPRVTVVRTAFEEWTPPDETHYDLVYAANSWHWLDPGTRWSRTADLLLPGGYVAVFGASHALPDGFDPIFTEIQSVYDEIGQGLGVGAWPPPPPTPSTDLADQAKESGRFRVVGQRMYVWALRYDAESYLNLLNTFSNHIAMEPSRRDHLYGEIRRRLAERPDGQLTRHWVSQLVVAQRA